MRQKKIRSVWPVYIAAGCWVLYASLFSLYSMGDFIRCIAFTLLGYFLSQKLFFKPKIVEIAPPEPAAPEPAASQYGPEIDAIIAEGARAQSEMGRLYQSIRDTNVKEKISELMRISDKIVEDAKTDPTDVAQIKKFLSYYLPTTIKLLNAYDRMGSQGIEGENISGTMSRIEDMLDTAIASYKKQLDSLFANQALDIETDIDTMNAMLKREGLAESDFKMKTATS
ncbi:MAG: 5-bromo-4-chloroindolyl phosphate hydrolysis family protein [Firmicutes bacterium]|nr:5-bromo-4-chloroindolyl phosphate hydrolysis family protein [Bacillota bacterium]